MDASERPPNDRCQNFLKPLRRNEQADRLAVVSPATEHQWPREAFCEMRAFL
jgi:hypothetical protein